MASVERGLRLAREAACDAAANPGYSAHRGHWQEGPLARNRTMAVSIGNRQGASVRSGAWLWLARRETAASRRPGGTAGTLVHGCEARGWPGRRDGRAEYLQGAVRYAVDSPDFGTLTKYSELLTRLLRGEPTLAAAGAMRDAVAPLQLRGFIDGVDTRNRPELDEYVSEVPLDGCLCKAQTRCYLVIT
jgi:hypothetical protein